MSLIISESRTKNYLMQLKASLIFRILTISSSFLIIPLMINYLGMVQYGIWSTLLSIVSWIVIFDIGIGSGLRNKISEALAKNDKKEARDYISTAYVVVGFVSVLLLLLFLLASNFISWQGVFNTTVLSNYELKNTVNITAFFLFLNFWLSLINQIFNGLQKTSIVIFNQFLSNFLALICVYVLYNYFESSLFKLAFIYGLSLIMSSTSLSLWFFAKNSEFIPNIKSYSNKHLKSITSLGFQFFIIQIAVVVIFTTDKILITQLFGPEHVTNYDIVFKLFSIITVAHSILMAPLWSAYSDAYHRNDLSWIKKSIKTQLKIYILFFLATIILGIFARKIIILWIGPEMVIDNMLVVAMILYILVSSWNNIFAHFLNGISKILLASWINILLAVINVPISILYVKFFNLGVEGIVLGTVTSLMIGVILAPLQSYNIIFGKGGKIWHR